ncbi:hypothetical protein BgiBS90_028883 [Biomphalaria glabrata]|nr:hypothetical protein BgiBS90_028883 [Biomphalaria glabrata]
MAGKSKELNDCQQNISMLQKKYDEVVKDRDVIVRKLTKEKESLQQNISSINQKNMEITAELNKAKLDYQELNSNYERLHNEATAVVRELQTTTVDKAAYDAKVKEFTLCQTKLSDVEKQYSDLKKDKDDADKHNIAMKQKLAQTEQQYDDVSSELRKLKMKTDENERKYRREIKELQTSLSTSSGSSESLQSSFEAMQKEFSKLQISTALKDKKILSLTKNFEEKEKALQSMKVAQMMHPSSTQQSISTPQYSELLKRNKALEQQIKDLQQSRTPLNPSVNLQHTYTSLKKQYDEKCIQSDEIQFQLNDRIRKLNDDNTRLGMTNKELMSQIAKLNNANTCDADEFEKILKENTKLKWELRQLKTEK